MASRVGGFGKKGVEDKAADEVSAAAAVGERVSVTADMLNEAVEQTLEMTDPQHAHSLRVLWSMDSEHEVARMYFADQVRQRTATPFSEIVRFGVTIDEVLTQEQTNKVIEYAPEYKFTFKQSVNHDHPFFSARRKVDNQILLSQFPATMPYIDFGGSIMHAINMSQERCTVVAPFDMDAKDSARLALTRMRLRQVTADDTRTPMQREMAASVLRGDGKYHLAERAQATTAKAKVGIFNHVYDVPLHEWPQIMHQCGIQVLEGMLHFSNAFWDADSCDIPYSGAHFEIDRAKDIFRMRVGESSTRWYAHKWTDYMRYGANQVMHTEHGTYSYQICERRTDTIRCRILRVDSSAQINRDQVYCLPDVPMAEVSGFWVGTPATSTQASVRSSLAKKKYMFPLSLWERMLSYAKAEVERGGLSYEKMYNHYRTVVPRQSINAVHISGGQSVPIDEVPALIVHAAIVAHCDILLVQRTIRARTDQVQAQRRLLDETTLVKLFRTFFDAIVKIGCLPLSPFSSLGNIVDKAYMTIVKDMMVMWEPQVRTRSLNMALLVNTKLLDYKVQTPTQIDFRPYVERDIVANVIDIARVDTDVADNLLALCGKVLPEKYKQKLLSVTTSETAVGSVVGDENDKPGTKRFFYKGVKKIRRTVMRERPVTEIVRERRLAVQEAIHESEVQTRALTSMCERIYREVLVAGKPNENIMRARKEEMYNPDLWRVRDGLLIESVLGRGLDASFSYSGVYIPIKDSNGANLVPVYEENYYGKDSASGHMVDRVHVRLPVSFTGYALVVDDLKIFNGPAITDTLHRALALGDDAFKFTITCHQGPPGCGKTTAVASDGDPSKDTYLIPTRIAMRGLRAKLLDKHKVSAHRVSTCCRTLDSLLANYHRLSAEAKQLAINVFIDEYVLAPSGKWYAAAALLGATYVHAYGDSKQIHHKPRVEVSQLFAQIAPDILEEEFITFRCAPKILAMFNPVYNNEIRSANNVPASITYVSDVSEVQWMPDCRALSMYQADKRALQTLLAHVKPAPEISTTHEGQGSDCDQVVLFNFETRKRGPEDTHYLFWLQEYVLVALSRCRVSFYYVKASREPDMVTQMIANADNQHAVQVCADIDTQGEPYN